MSADRSVHAPSSIAARQPAMPRSTCARSPHSIYSVPSWPWVWMKASGDGMDEVGVHRHVVPIISKVRSVAPPNPSEPLRTTLCPLASTSDGRTSRVRPTLRDEGRGRSGAGSGRARRARTEQTPPRRQHALPNGRGRPFRGGGDDGRPGNGGTD